MEQRTSSQERHIGEASEAATEARTAMTEKLEVLEDHMRETLESTRSAVEDIVHEVKGTVDDTVSTVKGTVDQARSTLEGLVENVKDTVNSTTTKVQQSFDVRYQMEQRPWIMFSGAVLTGYVLGSWAMQESARQPQSRSQGTYYGDDDNLYAAAMSSGATPKDIEEQSDEAESGHAYPSHMPKTPQAHSRRNNQSYEQSQSQESKLRRFHEEWNVLKSVALGTLMGTLRTVVRQQIPTLAPQIDNVINRVSAKLGTEPIDLWDSHDYSQDKGQPNASKNYTAYEAPTGAAQGSASASQGITDRPAVMGAQPRPYTQYRR